MFLRVVQNIASIPITCVIDGLDECDDDSSRWLSKKLDELMLRENPKYAVKIIIVSRDYLQGLDKLKRIKLDPDHDQHVNDDIDKVVSAKVQALSRIDGFDEQFRSAIQKTLLEKAEGTFLWVGFVTNELLQKRTCTEVQRALHGFPKELPAVYDRML